MKDLRDWKFIMSLSGGVISIAILIATIANVVINVKSLKMMKPFIDKTNDFMDLGLDYAKTAIKEETEVKAEVE